MPISCVHLVKCPTATVKVFVERGHVWPQMCAAAGGPHEQAERALKMLARQLFLSTRGSQAALAIWLICLWPGAMLLSQRAVSSRTR